MTKEQQDKFTSALIIIGFAMLLITITLVVHLFGGLSPDPMECNDTLQATYHFDHVNIDDEGISEAVGEFRSAGWDVQTIKNEQWHFIATCNMEAPEHEQ